MIKEVEIRSTTEYLEEGLAVNVEQEPEVVTAILSSNGTAMTVKVNRYLKEGSVRKVSLQYMLPAYEKQTVAEYELGLYEPSSNVDETTEYAFDLTPVLKDIIHTSSPEQVADDEIIVRLYTYEANISTDYGNKTLHVPYSVTYPNQMYAPKSTDGWYAIRVLDVDVWEPPERYYVDDVVFYNSAYYICLADCNNRIPTSSPTYWREMTDEEEHNLYEFGHEQSESISTILNANALITRYIKQKHIYDLLVKSNYKRYDNVAVVTQLEKIYAMREASIVHLNAGNPIYARYILDMIPIEVNSFMSNNGEKVIVETMSNFTV